MGGRERRVSRRSLLKAGGASAAIGAFGTAWRPLLDDRAHDRTRGSDTSGDRASNHADPQIDLAEVQGNVLAGFNKDHQRLLFFRLGDPEQARVWLATIVDETATTEEVLAFNDLFRRARARRGAEVSMPQASWLNIAFTHPGLAALGVAETELAMFPEAFRQGMAARAQLLGDVDESAPARWVGPFASSNVHGLLLLAADAPSSLDRLASAHTQRMAAHGVRVVFDDTGRVRADQPGHEHFGFKDGVSQPGIRGVTRGRTPTTPTRACPVKTCCGRVSSCSATRRRSRRPIPATRTAPTAIPGRSRGPVRRGRSTGRTSCSVACARTWRASAASSPAPLTLRL